MKRFSKRSGKYYRRLAALAAVLATVLWPVSLEAGVADESTFDSSVQGTNEVFYRTIATNYHAGNLPGMVSKTLAPEMDKAALITSDMKKQGYEPVLFIDDYSWDSEERKSAQKTAEEMGGVLVAMLDIQLFRYEVSSFVPVHEAGQKVTMIAEIPETATSQDGTVYNVLDRSGNREFAMVRVHDGQVTVLKDLDSDPQTLTFETDKFSAYGLMYAPTGAIDDYLNGDSPQEKQPAPEQQPAGQTTVSPEDELDEVPKTGDIFWEIAYGYVQ